MEYLIQKKARIILLPHSFHQFDQESNDYVFFKDLLAKYFNIHEKSIITNNILISHSIEETYNYYTENKMDLVLASRLHSIILSRVYKIPYIALSYSRKTDEQL